MGKISNISSLHTRRNEILQRPKKGSLVNCHNALRTSAQATRTGLLAATLPPANTKRARKSIQLTKALQDWRSLLHPHMWSAFFHLRA